MNEPQPRLSSARSSSGLFAAAVALGAGAPCGYYLARLAGWVPWPWIMPPHPPLAALVGVALVVGLGLATLALWDRLGPGPGRRGAAVAIAATFAALAGIRWHYHLTQLDGEIWLGLASDPFIVTSEPLGRWSHYIAYRSLLLVGVDSSPMAVRLSSVAAGVFLAAAIAQLTPAVFKRLRPPTAIMLIFVTPLTILYLGIAESTPWAYALTTTYLLLGLRYLRIDPPRAPWVESFVLMMAVTTHGMVLFATGAHVALILCWFFRRSEAGRAAALSGRLVRGAAVALMPFAPLVLIISFARLFGTGIAGFDPDSSIYGGGDHRRWIHFGSDPLAHEYLFLDGPYLRDLANLFARTCPIVFAVPAMALRLGIWRRDLVFLLSALGGLLFFTFLWNADYNMRDDLDLLCLFAVPTTLIVGLWCDEQLSAKRRAIFAIAAAAASFGFAVIPYVESYDSTPVPYDRRPPRPNWIGERINHADDTSEPRDASSIP